MPVNQILAKFYDCLKKITKKIRSVLESTVEAAMIKTSELNTGQDMMATEQTFVDELNEAAEALERKQKKELKRLKKENLSNFAIKGTDEDWGKALSSNKSSIISVKRYEEICGILRTILTFNVSSGVAKDDDFKVSEDYGEPPSKKKKFKKNKTKH